MTIPTYQKWAGGLIDETKRGRPNEIKQEIPHHAGYRAIPSGFNRSGTRNIHINNRASIPVGFVRSYDGAPLLYSYGRKQERLRPKMVRFADRHKIVCIYIAIMVTISFAFQIGVWISDR